MDLKRMNFEDKIREYKQGALTLDEVEEIFLELIANHIDDTFGYGSDSAINIFDDNMGLLSLESFYPELYGKSIVSSWIKVDSKEGYSVFYAKNSKRKNRFYSLVRDFDKNVAPDVKGLSIKQISKRLKLINDYRIEQFLLEFPFELKWAKVNTSKTGVKYFLPHEYEIAESPEIYLECQKDKIASKAVRMIKHFDSDAKNEIYYLRSRGISKEDAIRLIKLKEVHFEINTKLVFENYMTPA